MTLQELDTRLRAIEMRFEPTKYTLKATDTEYPELIMRIVEGYFDIHREKLIGKNRNRELVMARHIAIALIMKYTKLSLTQIGKIIGNRDHSTIIWARDEHQNRLSCNYKYYEAYKTDYYTCENRFLTHISRAEVIEEEPIINAS